ncbi:ABC transporter ATP-binding protein [Candidatus Dojkabacteria bacterium]|uniref:ABC transporter ATP-binding protein n=1 Tax=Candidatus Dojkabacteria bacterium TaxID=2099670 RepID=A0A955LB75_9BACT|nr:ABC transporter ATP-binding protein [Candidatus Dojkabacteria bacterium]
MKNITRLIKISKPLHKIMYLILGLSVFTSILSQIIPFVSKVVVDEVEKQIESETGDLNKLILFLLIGFGLAVLNQVLSSVSQRIGDHFGGEIRRFLIAKFYDHIFRLPQTYFDTEISGKVIHQLNRGISSVESFMKTASNFIFPSILLSIFTLITMFIFSWQVALFTILLFPIYTALSYYSSKKWGEKEVFKNKHEDNTRGRIQEVILNMRLVKGFSNQENEYKYVDEEQKTVNDIYANQSRTFHIFDFARNFSLELVLLGMNLVIFYNAFERNYTFGDVILLMQLIMQVRRPLFAMSFILTQIQQTEAGTKEFFEILDLEETEDYKVEIENSSITGKSIEFKNVSFKYSKEDKNILDLVSFKINRNEKVALVGHSGAGKTTIINLINKFYNPTGGEILVDNHEYSDLSHNEVRNLISLVFQENELFSTTIRENVSYGTSSTDEEIINALKSANAWSFVSNFDRKLDTQVGERGVKLSGGQKQRIQIARAILHNSPIVILDEATSNLDSKSEAEVQKAMEVLMQDRIVIIIAHRFSTIQNVDKILVIDNGKIVDSGSPKELSGREGIYRELLQYQVEGDKKLLENFEIY